MPLGLAPDKKRAVARSAQCASEWRRTADCFVPPTEHTQHLANSWALGFTIFDEQSTSVCQFDQRQPNVNRRPANGSLHACRTSATLDNGGADVHPASVGLGHGQHASYRS